MGGHSAKTSWKFKAPTYWATSHLRVCAGCPGGVSRDVRGWDWVVRIGKGVHSVFLGFGLWSISLRTWRSCRVPILSFLLLWGHRLTPLHTFPLHSPVLEPDFDLREEAKGSGLSRARVTLTVLLKTWNPHLLIPPRIQGLHRSALRPAYSLDVCGQRWKVSDNFSGLPPPFTCPVSSLTTGLQALRLYSPKA